MSTRSTITLKTKEGLYRTIYCHFDGYPSHHAPLLVENYDTYEKVEALISLGDLSILDADPTAPEGHSYNNQIDGHCVAYGRDRGEEGTQAAIYTSVDEIDAQEYNYIFVDGGWYLDNVEITGKVINFN